MPWKYPLPVLAAVVLLVLVSGAGAATGAMLAPGNPPEPTTENRPPSDGANFTVVPDDHSPGANTAYLMQSKGEGPWGDSRGLETIDFYKITTQETTFQDCTPSDARAFGIDRGNDDPGTSTDTSLLSHMEQYAVNGRVISVEIYDEGDLGGSPTYLNRSDETVAKLANCVVTPDEPGWYQFTGYVNGTNYQGQFQEVTLYSKYFYICDCGSRAEAEEKLGPPPHSGGGSEQATATSASASTATPASASTATPTPTSEPTSSSSSSTSTSRQTADTATPGSASSGSSSSATAARTATATSTTQGTEAETAAAAKGPEQSETGDSTTPTLASGPGFDIAVALTALAVVALLARRD